MAPGWLVDRLGWKPATKKSKDRVVGIFGVPRGPNLSDLNSSNSLRIAGHCYATLGVPNTKPANALLSESEAQDGRSSTTSDGAYLEQQIENDVDSALKALGEDRSWDVRRAGLVSQYAQFTHLADLERLVKSDGAEVLRGILTADYQVKSDVYVGVEREGKPNLLHAAISCKWTIRSDRVQNVRQEFGTLVRNRKGRLPHLVLVTAEPLPSRVISIARGTGELDAVYHLLYEEINQAMIDLRGEDRHLREQAELWEEMKDQRRIVPYTDLAMNLHLS